MVGRQEGSRGAETLPHALRSPAGALPRLPRSPVRLLKIHASHAPSGAPRFPSAQHEGCFPTAVIPVLTPGGVIFIFLGGGGGWAQPVPIPRCAPRQEPRAPRRRTFENSRIGAHRGAGTPADVGEALLSLFIIFFSVAI